MNKHILKRFSDLDNEIKDIINGSIEEFSNIDFKSLDINENIFSQWCHKLHTLIILSAGEDSMYNDKIKKNPMSAAFGGKNELFKLNYSLFKALKDDYENGYLNSIEMIAQADVLEDQLEQAKELLSKKYKLASAVIAGIVLETSLRKLCINHSINIGKLDKMNADLAKANVYNKLYQKKITALAEIRNSAAHGKDSEFTHDDVESMIRDIESFLENYL